MCKNYPKVIWYDLMAKIDFLACVARFAFALDHESCK
jgi:hypothetical protein